MLIDLSIKDFFSKMSSKDVPGGGSGAALIGTTGVSLLTMAAEMAQQEGYDLSKNIGELQNLQQSLLKNIDEDAIVLTNALPALTAVGPDGNSDEWNSVLEKAVEVPINIANAGVKALHIAHEMLKSAPHILICDMTFAAIACHSSVQGAILLANLNISLFRDNQELVEKYNQQIIELNDKANDLIQDINRE